MVVSYIRRGKVPRLPTGIAKRERDCRFDLFTRQEIFYKLAVAGIPRNVFGTWADYKRAKYIIFRGIDVNPAKYREQINALWEYIGRRENE